MTKNPEKKSSKTEWDLLNEEPEEPAEIEAEIENVNAGVHEEPTLPHEDIFPQNSVTKKSDSVTKAENSVTKTSKKPSNGKKSKISENNSVTKSQNSVTNSVPNSPELILDNDALWREFCDLRGSSGVIPLFALLTGKTVNGVKGEKKDYPHFYRGNAVAGLIKMYRELKKKGYL